jgi:hypothetical protein
MRRGQRAVAAVGVLGEEVDPLGELAQLASAPSRDPPARVAHTSRIDLTIRRTGAQRATIARRSRPPERGLATGTTSDATWGASPRWRGPATSETRLRGREPERTRWIAVASSGCPTAAHAAQGLDVGPGVASFAQPLTWVSTVGRDVGLDPHMSLSSASRVWTAAPRQEGMEQAELERGQADLGVVDPRPVGVAVDLEPAEPDQRRLALDPVRPAEQRAIAGSSRTLYGLTT